jgi:hypothetical protein
MRRILTLALLVAFALAGVASAQTLTGTITGKVTDQQGGVLPGVTMTLTGKTGSQTQVTDAQGVYRFLGLTPGTYNIKAELSGFKAREQQGIDVGMNKTIEVPLSMAVGGLTETVDVVANAVMIDTTSTATDTNLSQDLLFSMPLGYGNTAATIMNYSPGINGGSAFGGASDYANGLMLDGVDTRDPDAGSAWTFFNFDIVEEVQVGALGQPAEYGGFTGALVNSITKSGGNRFSFLTDIKYTDSSLSSDNTNAALIQKNLLLSDPSRNSKLLDYTVQLGGPIKKDKIFFFSSFQRYQIQTHNSGVKALRQEVSPRLNVKFTFQPTANDNIVVALQYDQYNQKGRMGLVPGYAATTDQTINQDSPEYIWNAQYRKVFNSTTFLEAKWTGYWGYYDLNPVNTAPTHYDGYYDTYTGGAGYIYQADRGRNQVNASLTKYAQFAGSHNFKFGVEIERSTVRSRYSYETAYFYDYDGAPYGAYGYSYDLQGKNKRESYYAQDQWKINRLSISLGVRADDIRGEATTTGKTMYSTFSVAPRLGFAWDVFGKGESVLKGFYGQMYDGAIFQSWARSVPGMSPNFVYIPNSDWTQLTVDSSTQRVYTVNSNIKQPRVDEINVSYEQLIGKNFKLTVTGIKRDWKNFINSTLTGTTWTPVPYTNPLTGATMATYSWANAPESGSGITTVANGVISNVAQVPYALTTGSTVLSPEAYRSYRGLMLVFQRALRNRWQAQISYVYSETKGTIGNSGWEGFNSNQFENANNALINTDGYAGYDRTHEFKAFAGYQIPKIEVGLNAYFRWMSGTPYTPYSRIRAGTLNWPFGSYLTPNLVAPGTYRNDPFSQTDLRLEKVFNAGFHRFGIYMDLQNLFNQADVTNRQTRYPNRNYPGPNGETNYVAFGDPVSISQARQAVLGLRWSF